MIDNLINELSNKLKKICNKGSKTSPIWRNAMIDSFNKSVFEKNFSKEFIKEMSVFEGELFGVYR